MSFMIGLLDADLKTAGGRAGGHVTVSGFSAACGGEPVDNKHWSPFWVASVYDRRKA